MFYILCFIYSWKI